MELIYNLAGVFSGEGLKKKNGRKVIHDDLSFIPGPVDLFLDQNGRIKDIQTSSPENLTRTSKSFDGTGLYASAAYLDTHTHTLFAGERASEYFMRWGGKTYLEISEAGGGIHNTVKKTSEASEDQLIHGLSLRLEEMLRLGSTSVEIKTGYASNARDELRYLQILDRFIKRPGHRKLPRIFRSFLGLHALPKGRDEAGYVDEMVAILDTIKSENLADFVDAFPEKGFFTLEASLRFAREAKSRGLRAKIHADELSDLGSAKAFAELGALSVDHLQKISDSGVEALSSQQTVAVMLPATSFFLNLEYANARRLLEAGARVALATDFNPGTAPSNSMPFTQLLAASQMKMSAAEILCASTYNAAGAVGKDNELGLLLKDYQADFLLWEPESRKASEILEEIFVTQKTPAVVFKQGQLAYQKQP